MREPVRVLHIGDVHLGVELYGRADPEKGYGTRVGDFLRALDEALEHAAETDLVLFPGDVYKNCEPSPTVQREFARRIRTVARERPVVIIPGNHDVPNTFARASSVEIFSALDVENVHVLRQPSVETIATARGPVLIAPLPFLPRSRLVAHEDARGKTISEVLDLMREKLVGLLGGLAARVKELRRDLGEDTPAILMAHYTVSGAVFGGYGRGALLAPEVELPRSAVKDEAFDYVALAHIHQHQSIPANDHSSQPPVVYPGSIERVDFGEEREDKVVVRADVARNDTQWRALPLHPRAFVTLRVDEVDEADPLACVLAAIEKKRERIPNAVVRLIYTLPAGQPNLPERDLRAALGEAACVAAIRRETPAHDPRTRNRGLTTQLSPLEALDEYLRTQPQLAGRRDDLLDRARPLIDAVLSGSAED